MIVRAICEKCNHKWDLEIKLMEKITCPNCKTVYNALKAVNDPENKETMRIIREQGEFVKKEIEKPYDYRSVIYAIEHIILVFEKDISPNLHDKLNHWKRNIQEELDKE